MRTRSLCEQVARTSFHHPALNISAGHCCELQTARRTQAPTAPRADGTSRYMQRPRRCCRRPFRRSWPQVRGRLMRHSGRTPPALFEHLPLSRGARPVPRHNRGAAAEVPAMDTRTRRSRRATPQSTKRRAGTSGGYTGTDGYSKVAAKASCPAILHGELAGWTSCHAIKLFKVCFTDVGIGVPLSL